MCTSSISSVPRGRLTELDVIAEDLKSSAGTSTCGVTRRHDIGDTLARPSRRLTRNRGGATGSAESVDANLARVDRYGHREPSNITGSVNASRPSPAFN